MENFVKPGSRVFVKPNLLLAADPDRAATTHPEVLIAVINELRQLGATVFFGDLPGGFHVGGTAVIQQQTGMKYVAEQTGAELVTLEKSGFREIAIPGGKRLKSIHVPRFLDEVDTVISVCKLKTHMQTLFTGAVKNMFGLTTTQDRINAHRFSKYEEFAQAVVDIFSVLTPALSIMDAVVGMEGTGPSRGSPVKLGFLAASADAVALDTVACSAVGFKPREIGTIKDARSRGLGAGGIRDINMRGAGIESISHTIKRPSSAVFLLMSAFAGPFTEITKVRPEIIEKKCTACGKCAEVCPAAAIAFNGSAGRIDDDKCLLCFCCHEICPHGAVGLNKPILVRSWEIFKNFMESRQR